MDVKVKYLLLEIRMLDVETRTVKARRCSVRHGDDFDWLGGHSENQGDIGAKVSCQASWLLFTPSLNKLIFGG